MLPAQPRTYFKLARKLINTFCAQVLGRTWRSPTQTLHPCMKKVWNLLL